MTKQLLLILMVVSLIGCSQRIEFHGEEWEVVDKIKTVCIPSGYCYQSARIIRSLEDEGCWDGKGTKC